MKSKFKVGDKVRVLKDNYGYKEGDKGVVKEIPHLGRCIVFVNNRKSTSSHTPCVSFSDRDLELISDKIEVSKTFLLEGYEAACDQWKKRIKKEAPELFEDDVKLEVGKWYKVKDLQSGCSGFNGLGLATEKNPDSGLLSRDKGFNLIQTNGVIWKVNGDFTEAEPSEVKSELVKEAKKRGYKVGVKIKPLGNYPITTIDRLDFSYWCTDGEITLHVVAPEDEWEESCSNPPIFKNGKWAEIIKEEKVELTLQEIADKFGVSVESLRVKE